MEVIARMAHPNLCEVLEPIQREQAAAEATARITWLQSTSCLQHKDWVGDALKSLETLGSRVGCSLVERTSRDAPRFKNELDAVVFICKQFWNHAFNKQIDNLKTNHQDTYVLHDYNFRLLSNISRGNQYKEQAPLYLAFTCGLLAGALTNLGIRCQVTAEVTTMPACIFQIKVLL